MLEKVPADSLDPKREEIRQEMATHIVPPKRQKEIRRVFGEKIKFLSEEHDIIPLPCARALKHLHDYRNETQPSGSSAFRIDHRRDLGVLRHRH
jgi:hypothetical protein